MKYTKIQIEESIFFLKSSIKRTPTQYGHNVAYLKKKNANKKKALIIVMLSHYHIP